MQALYLGNFPEASHESAEKCFLKAHEIYPNATNAGEQEPEIARRIGGQSRGFVPTQGAHRRVNAANPCPVTAPADHNACSLFVPQTC